MPYIIGNQITPKLPELWFEGSPYERKKIYRINEPNSPPVNYDTHILKPHSIPHAESPLHTQVDGKGIENFFDSKKMICMFGESIVIKLKGDNFKLIDKEKNIKHWEVRKEELQSEILRLAGANYNLQKLILTVDDNILPHNEFGTHDPNHVLTLSIEAAQFLVDQPNFNAYITSWKSTDFQPGKKDRPIHNKIFEKALIYECMNLRGVPEGIYFFVGIPIPLVGASESPCTPILFTKEEIKW